MFSLLLLVNFKVFATVQTQIDKTSIASDEMVTLTISSTDHLSLSPDIEPLKNDFSIVGTSQNSSFNIVNGTASIATQWQITLLPKHPGDIQIPVLTVGKEHTTAQILHVAGAKNSTNMLPVTSGDEIYFETSVTPKEAFIKEQFVYTVKLYFSRSIENAYLMPPDMPDAKISQNGQDIIYSVTRKGHYFRVLERSYLITPEKTGQFKIQPPVLKGYLETTADRYDLYGLGSHAVKPIKVVGQFQEVRVKPKPANFVGHWFPAKKVTIQEMWEPSPPIFREGEPVTRGIEVSAVGATGDQIPNIAVDQSIALNSYAQNAKRDTTTDNGQQIGSLKQNVVYIPTSAGKQILPAIKVKWWNSITKKEEVAVLRSKIIKVLPAINRPTSATTATNSLAKTATSTPKPKELPKSKYVEWASIIWPTIAFLALVLWLATLYLWRKQTSGKQYGRKKQYSLKALSAALKETCSQNNAKRTRQLVLSWGALYWKNHRINNLAEVATILENERADVLLKEIMALEANFYANHKEKWSGENFWQAFHDYQLKQTNDQKEKDDPLPPLYCP